MRSDKLFILFALLLMVASGCSPQSKPTSVTQPPPALPGLAPVTRIEVVQSAATKQVLIVAHGQIPDTCTKIDQVKTDRTEHDFAITITTLRSEGANCSNQPADFTKQVEIDFSGLPSGSYNLIVNGVNQAFTYTAPGQIPASQVPAETATSLTAAATTTISALPSTETPSVTEPGGTAGKSSGGSSPTGATPSPTAASSATANATASSPAATPRQSQSASTPQPTGTPSSNNTSGGCTDRASFENDVTIPDNTLFHQGDTFVKTWRIYNAGTCPWTTGYYLVFVYGELMKATPPVPIPPTDPGQSVDLTVNLAAPATPGQYAGNWKIQNPKGDHFGFGLNGDPIWVQILVSYVGQGNGLPATGSGGSSSPTPTTTASSVTAVSTACNYQENSDYENQVMDQINQVRESAGRSPLTFNPTLAASAKWYSVDMACNNRTDPYHHSDSRGPNFNWVNRIHDQGYFPSVMREIVAYANPKFGGTPQYAMNWWMNDPPHKEIILDPSITEFGAAFVYYENSDDKGYYTVDFAKP
ncbi:MAG TPA: NBR1-Ig-like domain-containing protein [Anaerolineales bacterium]